MAYYAVIKGDRVDGIAIADAPLDTDGMWIDVTNVDPIPARDWKYEDGKFVAPPDLVIQVLEPPTPPKTEEQKIADATAAAIAKLIADGVLKQA